MYELYCILEEEEDWEDFMKRVFGIIAGIVLLQTSGYAGVTVYQHINYAGTSTKYGVGGHDYDEIRRKAPGDDEISSVRVDPGYRVILYFDPNFRGRSLAFTKNTPNLVDFGMNDQTSSLRVEKIPVDGKFKRWENTGYAGKSATWKIGEYANVAGNFASVFIPKGHSVTLFSSANFAGNAFAIYAQESDVWIDDLSAMCASVKSCIIEKIEK